MLSLEGKQLGNYDITKRIRVGGMGAVYEGRQRTAFDRRVAIKVILGDYAADRDMRRRFMREARTVARLHHPHILQLIEFGDEHGILYLVMPFIEGGTLTSYLRRHLPEMEDVIAIYEQLLDAVEYAHEEGLIHRDIKSSNVLLEPRRSGTPYVYLADFGLVRTRRQVEMEDTGKFGKPIPLDQVPGTPHYMAPEQTMGIVTPLTDIYALGVLLYQLLIGELPYDDPDDIRVIQMHLNAPVPSPCDRDASIPRALGEVVRTAMSKRAQDRYQSVGELRDAFFAALNAPPDFTPVKSGTLSDATWVAPDISPAPKHVTPAAALHEQSDDASPLLRRVKGERGKAALVAVREARERARVTDALRQRTTEEAAPEPRYRRLSLVAALLVPVVLIVLLLMPRVLGVSFFPDGFPLFGMAPMATVYITAQNKTLQENYILTASPLVKEANADTHTIPSRTIQVAMSGTDTKATTGTHTMGQEQAQGSISFVNVSSNPVQLPAQLMLTTQNGVQIRLVQDVQVPPHHEGHDGRIEAPAIAMNAGSAGNIPAHALDGSCCNNGVTASNPEPFSGGSDGQVMHVVAQADVTNIQQALSGKIEQQLTQQIRGRLLANEVIAGAPVFTVTTDTSSPVGAQADHVQVTVHVSANASVYNSAVAAATATRLLNIEAAHALGSAYHLQAAPSVTPSSRVQIAKNGIAYISVATRATWIYTLNQSTVTLWSQSIKGAPTAAALAFLNQQPGVKSVDIHLPFGTDHLPNTSDQIRIILLNSPSS